MITAILKVGVQTGSAIKDTRTFRHYLTDYQGNNIAVADDNGFLLEQTDYYPYGEPWREPDHPYTYSDNERLHAFGQNQYDFHARRLVASLLRFDKPDPLMDNYPWLSPYTYCGGNPIGRIDPNGKKIQGVTGSDTKQVISDIKSMFKGPEFKEFRKLIKRSNDKQNKNTLAEISAESVDRAFNGIELNEDQKALVDIIVNTINSDKIHSIEYCGPDKELTDEIFQIFSKGMDLNLPPEIVAAQGGYSNLIILSKGGGANYPTEDGSTSIVYNSQEFHSINREATVAHEIIGHGVSYVSGYTDDVSQHVIPIQVENLVGRVMGVDKLRDGSNHGPLY